MSYFSNKTKPANFIVWYNQPYHMYVLSTDLDQRDVNKGANFKTRNFVHKKAGYVE